jgi:dihydroxyacetone kinase
MNKQHLSSMVFPPAAFLKFSEQMDEPPRCLLNQPQSSIVSESLTGLLATRPDLVRLIDPTQTHSQIITRKTLQLIDPSQRQVAVISGGGAGHEPMHAGFVSDGLLTAAVSGDVFASPTSIAVQTAIRHVTGAAGCLLVVKN